MHQPARIILCRHQSRPSDRKRDEQTGRAKTAPERVTSVGPNHFGTAPKPRDSKQDGHGKQTQLHQPDRTILGRHQMRFEEAVNGTVRRSPSRKARRRQKMACSCGEGGHPQWRQSWNSMSKYVKPRTGHQRILPHIACNLPGRCSTRQGS